MFTINSKFYQGCIWVYRLVVINILFIVASLPLITFGASFQAMIQVLDSSDTSPIVVPFFRAFKKQFVKTLPLLGFNVFTIMFIFSLNQWISSALIFSFMLKWLFIAFLLSYNINLYILHLKVDYNDYFQLFRMNFYLTIITFIKVSISWVIYFMVILGLLKNFPILFFLFGWSMPVFIQMYLVRKDYQYLDLLKK